MFYCCESHIWQCLILVVLRVTMFTHGNKGERDVVCHMERGFVYVRSMLYCLCHIASPEFDILDS